jgi:monothiol glutaredoxin
MPFDPNEPELDADEVRDRVDTAIEENEVVLFMKGTELMPQCGYSERALGLIDKYRDDYEVVDTLQNLDVFREALDAHSGWETTPQTFVEGEFVGGSDILAELDERGELAETLNVDPDEVEADADASDADDAGVDAPF